MRGTVVVIACQHCRNARTMRLGLSVRFCFNCRRACGRTPANLPIPYIITTAELRRIATHQVAIQAGVYTDFPESSVSSSSTIQRRPSSVV
jgi:hypothetical protein